MAWNLSTRPPELTSGAAQAAELTDDVERARGYDSKLVEVSRFADTERAELREAKTFLKRKHL